MSFTPSRLSRLALLLAAFVGLAQPLVAALAKPAAATPAVAAEKPVPWLYKGSDIPPDPAWTFGILPNGVRYAVRRNGVPPGQVSVRVDIETGSLNETASELGFAHFMEHLSFRGSKYIADGEAIKTWQRLGATFGSDTNASTTNTQTIYKLDLPGATRTGLEESIKILSGMMAAPEISALGVDTERRTVLAEAREQPGPSVRAGDASRALFFDGQLLATRPPIGTTATLNGATPAALRAFHDRWYRPERAIVVMAGDGEPALFAALITKYFSDWKGIGAPPPDPDFGKPNAAAPTTSVLAEPGLPLTVSMGIMRPWFQKNDTVAYNQGRLVDLVALRLINRRLEERARVGGSFLQAQVDQEDVARSVDGTFISVVPLGDDWLAALKDVRAVIADASVNPSEQEDIDREAGEFFAALQQAVETQRTEAGAKQADDLIEAVNIRETVASAQVALDVFGGIKDGISPAAILASTKKLFIGTPARALLMSPTAVAGAQAQLAAALAAPVEALASARSGKAVSFDQLPKLGAPGKVVKRVPLTDLGMEQINFANGTKLIVFPNDGETGKIYVSVRFGRGLQALPRNKATVAWAGGSALLASGVGDLDQNALDRLTSGRKISAGFDISDNSFSLRAQTRPVDLADQLKLLAALITAPRWDAAPVLRARASFLAGYDTLDSGPQPVLSRDLSALLHGGDQRWATPTREEVKALTPEQFRALWEPLLKIGPMEVMVFGDVTTNTAIKLVGDTFGALPNRAAGRIASGGASAQSVRPNRTPLILTHKGSPDQAAAVLAWPTGGGIASVYEARKLELLSAIFNDRLFNQLRDGEGASYSPNASSQWPMGLKGGGNFVVSSQLQPGGVDLFFRLSRSIAADLASKPVSADELQRAVRPLRELIARISTGNSFWLGQLAGATQDDRRVSAVKSLATDYGKITSAELQAAAKKWFKPGRDFTLIVRPEAR
jgi:zinc protease